MKLIDDWLVHWWNLASTRVSMVAGVAVGYFAANPAQWNDIMAHLPWWAPILIGLGYTVATGGARVVSFNGK